MDAILYTGRRKDMPNIGDGKCLIIILIIQLSLGNNRNDNYNMDQRQIPNDGHLTV